MTPIAGTSGFVGRVLGARWVVADQIGSGSFGVVHAGLERGTGLPVAVKLLHPQFLHQGETIERFWNEAEALRRMNHPNVLALLDVGVAEDGVPFLVTELLTGETLRDLLLRERILSPERAMRLLGPAAHALHHAHLAGVVHRDLKPENIFRVRKDGMGTTKILDIGVAKQLETQTGKKLSQTGVMIGTMAYSPPEQMQGIGDIDHRADQFGFAALMFEVLTGRRPFPPTQPFALFQAVLYGKRPNASEINPALSTAVDAVLIRALEPEREKRYGSVEEFYLALTHALTSPNVRAAVTTFQGAPPIPLVAHTSDAPARQTLPPPNSAKASVVSNAKPTEETQSARYRPLQGEATKSDVGLVAWDGHGTMMSGAIVRPVEPAARAGEMSPMTVDEPSAKSGSTVGVFDSVQAFPVNAPPVPPKSQPPHASFSAKGEGAAQSAPWVVSATPIRSAERGRRLPLIAILVALVIALALGVAFGVWRLVK
ncbi:MAG: hypothetical protein NVSMB1_12710 [Polyangiales bacterium]